MDLPAGLLQSTHHQTGTCTCMYYVRVHVIHVLHVHYTTVTYSVPLSGVCAGYRGNTLSFDTRLILSYVACSKYKWVRPGKISSRVSHSRDRDRQVGDA